MILNLGQPNLEAGDETFSQARVNLELLLEGWSELREEIPKWCEHTDGAGKGKQTLIDLW